MPAAATSGTGLIKQVRNGVVIATYDKFGYPDGPFVRSHAFNKSQPGDVYEVYPAVYEGTGNHGWIGPLANNDADWAAGIFQTPTDVTIRGITVNGVRPVLKLNDAPDYNNYGHGLFEIEGVQNLLWENIDIDGSNGTTAAMADRAGFYIYNSRDVTIRNSRIHDFQRSDNNGVFGAGGNSGTLWLDNVRLYNNGGWDGPSHAVYINASEVDPNFTAKLTNSYSTLVNVGHLFKSRAQVTVIEGNLLEGTNTPAGWDCAESYDLDTPEGGRVTVRNNVLIKAKSGACGNGILLRYAAEQFSSQRAHSLTIDHNTFIARSTVWDDAGHPNVPIGLFSPLAIPGQSGFPLADASVTANRFEGFSPSGDPALGYRGTNYVDIPAAG